jgi:hypothetical protein
MHSYHLAVDGYGAARLSSCWELAASAVLASDALHKPIRLRQMPAIKAAHALHRCSSGPLVPAWVNRPLLYVVHEGVYDGFDLTKFFRPNLLVVHATRRNRVHQCIRPGLFPWLRRVL